MSSEKVYSTCFKPKLFGDNAEWNLTVEGWCGLYIRESAIKYFVYYQLTNIFNKQGMKSIIYDGLAEPQLGREISMS